MRRQLVDMEPITIRVYNATTIPASTPLLPPPPPPPSARATPVLVERVVSPAARLLKRSVQEGFELVPRRPRLRGRLLGGGASPRQRFFFFMRASDD